MILVKNISSLSEARYCAGMTVDFISFDFSPESDTYVNQFTFSEIRNWVSGIKILGNYQWGLKEQIQKIIDELKLDGFIFNEDQISLAAEIVCKIKIVEIPKTSVEHENYTQFDGIILTGGFSENETFENPNGKFTLVGFDFENIEKNIKGIAGYAFLGSKELSPGQNNYDELMDALDYIEEHQIF